MNEIGEKTMEVSYLPVHKTIVDLLKSEGSVKLKEVPLLTEKAAQNLAYHKMGEDGRVLQVPYDSITTTSGSYLTVPLELFSGRLSKEYVAGISNAQKLESNYMK